MDAGQRPRGLATMYNAATFAARQRWTMNRQKKLKQLLKAHQKKANAKLAPKSNKPKYISKADRLKLQADTIDGAGTDSLAEQG